MGEASFCHYNASCAMFCAQVLFSVLTMVFCMIMIARADSSQTTSIFLPILSGVVSVWMPSPNVPRRGRPKERSPPPSPGGEMSAVTT